MKGLTEISGYISKFESETVGITEKQKYEVVTSIMTAIRRVLSTAGYVSRVKQIEIIIELAAQAIKEKGIELCQKFLSNHIYSILVNRVVVNN